MEENFSLTWDDPTAGVHQEEVICGSPNEFTEVCEEVVVQENVMTEDAIVPENEQGDNIVYLTEDNNLVVMQTTAQAQFQEQFIECEVQEEVVADDWAQQGSEITVGEVGAEEQIAYDEVEIPLAADQDEYTASRPYPCDFCSRRFRKKANLMNHMVAHQTERPHGCNLCGARYIRKCDLMNHLKIHAYIPESSALDNDLPPLIDDESDSNMRQKKKPSPTNAVSFKKRRPKQFKIKEEDLRGEDGARSFDYVDEDMRLLTEMENHSNADYLSEENRGMVEPRYPITDARKPFVCQHCGVGFAREKALASHARIHGGDSPFECETCGEMFWDVALLREHVRSKHGGIMDDDYDDEDDEFNVEDEEKFGEFFCQQCGMSFHRQDLLKRHARMHIKDEFLSDDFGHTCNVCGESFVEALDLLAHAEVHARGVENRCNLCGELCGDEQAVAAHVMQRHGKNLPPNTCMLCGRTCKDRRTLLKHSWEHSKEKTFSCSKCGKNFHSKARLKRHMMSHRSKIVTCDVCGEDFPDGRTLMNHRHSHSNISGRQFPCRECGKTFGSRSSQQIHIRIHTGERPYGCRFCWKAFADGGTLRKHERIHTGEKPYACAVCPRAFNQRVVLREHIRSHHSGPDPTYSHTTNPYCCAVCNDLFSSSQDLIIHLINHCDMNTAMKRQPQVGPRKYKRRRKLKPHELEYISQKEDDDEDFTDSGDEMNRKRFVRKQKKTPPSPAKKTATEEGYESIFQNFTSAIQNINSLVNSKPSSSKSAKKKFKIADGQVVTPRPKMIHTQKTRVPVDAAGANDGGKPRHKTKTLITRTLANSDANGKGERVRPRTKNVNYHVLAPDKYPLATFEDDTEEAVNNLLATSAMMEQQNGDVKIEPNVPDVAGEETVICAGGEQVVDDADNDDSAINIPIEEQPTSSPPRPTPPPPPLTRAPTRVTTRARQPPKRLVALEASSPSGSGSGSSAAANSNSLKPGKHLIGPANKIVRYVKGGMVVSKKRRGGGAASKAVAAHSDHDGMAAANVKRETEAPPPPLPKLVRVKREALETSSLHELAELSMQHAKNQFKCEMCSEVFSDRTQLLLHVPIHI